MLPRTDLAIESHEMCRNENNGGEVSGVKVDISEDIDGIKTTAISIFSEEGSRAMGKPCGNYITVETGDMSYADESGITHRAAKAAAAQLQKLIPFRKGMKILIAGLGNRKITPDSLGPVTLDKIEITRHYFETFGSEGYNEMSSVCGINPGVMGTTGIESADLVRKAAEIVRPDAIIAIDSLAARDINRISTTIQINDTGIFPGAGTGNRRKAINKDTAGTNVIAIGVPTVIDASAIIHDALKNTDIDESLLEPEARGMIVTSCDIDQVINVFSDIISEAVNISLHPGIYSNEQMQRGGKI